MPARLSAFVIWAVVAAGVMFWGLRLGMRPDPGPANVQAVTANAGTAGDFTRLLGAAPAAASVAAPVQAASNRFRLLGVLAPWPASSAARPSSAGVALIAVDGKMARAYAVGAQLDGEWVLQSISRRSATIGPAEGAAGVVLELPPPAPPATGTLPRAVAEGEQPRAVPQAPVALPPSTPPMVQPQFTPPQTAVQPQFMPPQSAPPQAPAQQAADANDDESQPAPSSRRRGGAVAR